MIHSWQANASPDESGESGMENIRQAAGFNEWLAACKTMQGAPLSIYAKVIPSYPTFSFEGETIYYWPATTGDGVTWPHGFSSQPMRP